MSSVADAQSSEQAAMNTASSNPYAHEPTLADLIRDLWVAKWILLISFIIGLGCVQLFISSAVPQYRVHMLVGPVDRAQGADIQALMPENSSFAVQYLVNTLGSQDSSDFMRFENTLRERSVAEQLFTDDKIREGVAADYAFSFLSDGRVPANVAEMAVYIKEAIQVEPVGSSNLRRIVYVHPDQEFAAYMLTKMRAIADSLIKDDIRAATARRKAYLQTQLGEIRHPDHRRALTSLLMEQEHIQMILAVDEPFAAKIIEPATAGPKPYWPKPALHGIMIVLSIMLGAYIMRSLVLTLRTVK